MRCPDILTFPLDLPEGAHQGVALLGQREEVEGDGISGINNLERRDCHGQFAGDINDNATKENVWKDILSVIQYIGSNYGAVEDVLISGKVAISRSSCQLIRPDSDFLPAASLSGRLFPPRAIYSQKYCLKNTDKKSRMLFLGICRWRKLSWKSVLRQEALKKRRPSVHNAPSYSLFHY